MPNTSPVLARSVTIQCIKSLKGMGYILSDMGVTSKLCCFIILVLKPACRIVSNILPNAEIVGFVSDGVLVIGTLPKPNSDGFAGKYFEGTNPYG